MTSWNVVNTLIEKINGTLSNLGDGKDGKIISQVLSYGREVDGECKALGSPNNLYNNASGLNDKVNDLKDHIGKLNDFFHDTGKDINHFHTLGDKYNENKGLYNNLGDVVKEIEDLTKCSIETTNSNFDSSHDHGHHHNDNNGHNGNGEHGRGDHFLNI